MKFKVLCSDPDSGMNFCGGSDYTLNDGPGVLSFRVKKVIVVAATNKPPVITVLNLRYLVSNNFCYIHLLLCQTTGDHAVNHLKLFSKLQNSDKRPEILTNSAIISHCFHNLFLNLKRFATSLGRRETCSVAYINRFSYMICFKILGIMMFQF